ncbi:hypothetical protein MOK15_12300 [Sphingobium sp. BYY-5]|uniref:hypothetical protein n=1 Tax=Sphingobium sp. BYY-5 TaxID=2926400 RepID=UPI001FA7492D|nr:hypothetical protein [Sphingobium sp. BYY-5]MCI4590868.1 hypothetical protein [Sphingobium sp. BYY-5]
MANPLLIATLLMPDGAAPTRQPGLGAMRLIKDAANFQCHTGEIGRFYRAIRRSASGGRYGVEQKFIYKKAKKSRPEGG